MQEKLIHLKDYTRINVKTLKLGTYREKLQKQFAEERLFLKNKLEEERINFEILMEKTRDVISKALDKLEDMIYHYWEQYNTEADRHLHS